MLSGSKESTLYRSSPFNPLSAVSFLVLLFVLHFGTASAETPVGTSLQSHGQISVLSALGDAGECEILLNESINALQHSEQIEEIDPTGSLQLEIAALEGLAAVYSGECAISSASTQKFQSTTGAWNGACVKGYTLCSTGEDKKAARTCCQDSTQSCQTLLGNAWCAPKKVDDNECTRRGEKLCEGDGGRNICCPKEYDCKKDGPLFTDKYAYCALPEQPGCQAGATACRKSDGTILDCCTQNETCVELGWGYRACSVKENGCSEGETRCVGAKYAICCGPGTTCSPSTSGNPNCIPNDGIVCSDEETSFDQELITSILDGSF